MSATSLAILDGNCFIHSGEATWSKNYSYMGFPTSGIYHLMSKIVNLYTKRIDFAVVFDSPSFRKSVNQDYKASRKVDPKILAQINAIKPFIVRAGVNVLQVDEFEGDDLIANIVEANKFRDITIYTCDYDMALNVRQSVSLCGCKTDFPAVSKDNFEAVVSNVKTIKKVVPYNALAMYKIVFGDDSDEYAGVGPEAEKVWDIFIQIMNRDYVARDKVLITTRKYCESFIGTLAPYFSKETVERFKQNIVMVFPRMLTESEIVKNNINLTKFDDVCDTDLADACHLFGLKKSYRMLMGSEDYNLSDKEKAWLMAKARKYKQKVDAIEADIDMHAEVSYSGSDLKQEDDYDNYGEFNDVVDGCNVGGF